ncbi:E3 ubiquitin-protein ligase WAV3-like [Zingiber officinale]|uniref:Uncharacterized protein n=1 Tax=Zingiber officinale TaxID=94328 RepID=A0A8J5HUN1_ZINOF|nr:E3 ubiquitin-protein ligase WAV3-like [Zingiber officinale]KAG6536231.1 hypothetical protein ZIOFF_001282 [Zingiber officinale]
MGGSGWRKALRGFKLCVDSPLAEEGDNDVRPPVTPSDPSAASPSPDPSDSQPPTPTQLSSGVRPRVSTSGSGLSKRTCAICLTTMKPGQGHAIFTAECSHSFHFHCIASCIKYGNHVCPVCRAKWKEIPFQGPSNSPRARSTVNPVNINRHHAYSFQHRLLLNLEPCIFNDDEALDTTPKASGVCHSGFANTVVITTSPEYSAIPESTSTDNFTILIHLKAPLAPRTETSSQNVHVGDEFPRTHRAPVDIVTVLDVSGSMSGTKLSLLKQAMGFVIQNLGPLDRLSVIAFSSTARRLFPLRRMSEFGRQEALQAVNALATSGGTNITEGLRKGAKVIQERKEKNPVCSIILLSDGQDTYILSPAMRNGRHMQPDYRSLVPSSIRDGTVHNVPVHVFGFGSDHDSVSMHSISETSGGTFSFIEAEGAIQDAFAQCIGGLLSVVVQEMHVQLECLHHDVQLQCIKSGRYASWIRDARRSGTIDAGDLYADEERDYLVSVNVPPDHHETQLLKVSCVYSDPVTKGVISPAAVELKISRPESVVSQPVSIEVDRQRNRLHAAEAMAKAKAAAEHGELSEAVCLLEECRKRILESEAAKSGDQLCATLDAELTEMQARMVDRQRYEASGRAYVLSGLSSHLCQRATMRGDSTHSGNFTQSYQTPSMADMIQRSQTFSPAIQHSNSKMRHTMSFPAGPKPR